MKKTMPLLFATALALSTAAAIGGAGCKTTSSPGTQTDDAGIKVAVKAKLASDVRFSTLTNVAVNSTNGVVTLAGQVGSEADREAAGQLARSVKGVVRVNNELQVEKK
ncbi:MAG: BON domain-containing protein [Acidobacteriota bacterium]